MLNLSYNTVQSGATKSGLYVLLRKLDLDAAVYRNMCKHTWQVSM